MAEMAGSLGDGSQVGLAGHHQVGIDNTRPDATQKPDCTGPCRILLLFGFIVGVPGFFNSHIFQTYQT